MKKFWIIFAVLSIIGIIVIWFYTKNNKKKQVVYQQEQAEEVGVMDYINSVTAGLNALKGFGSTVFPKKEQPKIASTGGSGGIIFTPTPGVKYPSLSDLKT